MATKKKWYQVLIDILYSIFNKPKPEPPPDKVYIVEQGKDKRKERIAKSISFDITPARDGDQNLEDVPVWAYAGTNPDTWNGGNNIGLLSVRVKANDTNSYELKVGPTADGVQEPNIQGPCKAGVKINMKLELLPNGVRFTTKYGEGKGDSKFVECATAGDHTIGIGWPPQKRNGCLGAKIENEIWE